MLKYLLIVPFFLVPLFAQADTLLGASTGHLTDVVVSPATSTPIYVEQALGTGLDGNLGYVNLEVTNTGTGHFNYSLNLWCYNDSSYTDEGCAGDGSLSTAVDLAPQTAYSHATYNFAGQVLDPTKYYTVGFYIDNVSNPMNTSLDFYGDLGGSGCPPPNDFGQTPTCTGTMFYQLYSTSTPAEPEATSTEATSTPDQTQQNTFNGFVLFFLTAFFMLYIFKKR